MKANLLRMLARRCAQGLCRLCPTVHSTWASAMAAEVDAIECDREALSYALGCLWVVGGMALACRATPRRIGQACGVGATLMGCAVMASMGAPSKYIALQASALLIAWGSSMLLPKRALRRGLPRIALGAGMALLATAFFGLGPEGAARWVAIGPLHVQSSVVLLPLMVVAWAGRPNREATLGMGLAAAALPLQGDGVMATALLAALLPNAWRARSAHQLGLLAWAFAGWAVTMYQTVPGDVAPFVDGVITAAFGSSTFEGVVLCLGLAALVVPALRVRQADNDRPAVVLRSFGLFWGSLAVLAMLRNSPAPLVGFGGSAVLGYFLSLGGLDEPASSEAG